MPNDWNSFGGRLRWAIAQAPKHGRKHGLRYFQELMQRRAEEVQTQEGIQLLGVALSSIQTYVPTEDRPALAEPSLRFALEAARILGVREAWLTSGDGAPTEEGERRRRDNSEEELFAISTALYEALGIPTRIGTDLEGGDRARFWGSAQWAPLVRQTALRLYQNRPAWALLQRDGAGLTEGQGTADAAYEAALRSTIDAVASGIRSLGIDASYLGLTEVADYVSSMCLTLQRVIDSYVPAERAQVPPAVSRAT